MTHGPYCRCPACCAAAVQAEAEILKDLGPVEAQDVIDRLERLAAMMVSPEAWHRCSACATLMPDGVAVSMPTAAADVFESVCQGCATRGDAS